MIRRKDLTLFFNNRYLWNISCRMCCFFRKQEFHSIDNLDLIRIFDAYNLGKHVPLFILNMRGESLAELSMFCDSNDYDDDDDDDDNTHDNDNGRRRRGETIMGPMSIKERDRQIEKLTSGPCERFCDVHKYQQPFHDIRHG